MVFAERFKRAQCRSMSGVTPSKWRAPSKTVEASQAPWVRGPMIGTLPSCHSPSKNVSVRDQVATAFLQVICRHMRGCRRKGQRGPCMGAIRHRGGFGEMDLFVAPLLAMRALHRGRAYLKSTA